MAELLDSHPPQAAGLSNCPIYLLTGEYPPRSGGVADYTARLAWHLKASGLDVRVLVGSDHPAVDNNGLEAPLPRVRALTCRLESWALLPTVARLLRQRPGILHIQYQTGAFGMHPAVNLLPGWLRWTAPASRTVVTFHDVRLPYLFPKAGYLRVLANRALLARSHAAIFADAGDIAWAGRRPNQTLIPVGSGLPRASASHATVTQWRTRLGNGSEELLVGYFGFLNATKGVETLLDAVAGLLQAGKRVRLAMIGEPTGYADPTNLDVARRIQDQIARLGLEAHVSRTGPLPVEDASACLQACDVLALPFRDGASFRRSTLAAALAHGRPVITTRRPDGHDGLPGLCDGEHLLLVPPDDPAALAEAVQRLALDSEFRERLARGAASAAEERLNWPAIARATAQVYMSLAPPILRMTPCA